MVVKLNGLLKLGVTGKGGCVILTEPELFDKVFTEGPLAGVLSPGTISHTM